MDIAFAEYRPDVADVNGAFTGDLSNVFAADGSYIPVQKLEAFSAALPGKPLAAIYAKDASGNSAFFAGTATGLYRYDTATNLWSDVGQGAEGVLLSGDMQDTGGDVIAFSGDAAGDTMIQSPASAFGGYSATDDEPWDFAVYGNNIIAVNANDAPQVSPIASAGFEDLAGSPPQARYVAVWGDQLALGGLVDFPNRVQWSEINDIAVWDNTGNSGYQDFPDGGAVRGMTSNTNPLIFQESAIRKAQFVPGSVEVYTFMKAHDGLGLKAPRSLCTQGSVSFFYSDSGFYLITNDGAVSPVGYERVDRTVVENVDALSVADIQGVIDPVHTRAFFSMKFSASAAVPDVTLVYDWTLQRWSRIDGSVTLNVPGATVGQTLEGLAATYPDLDTMGVSLDSRAFQGGSPLMAGFTADYRLGFYTGANMEATITTQEMGDLMQVTRITSVYPVVDNAAVAISIGGRSNRGSSVNWTPEQGRSTNTGRIHKRSRARFHRIKVRVPEGEAWSHAAMIQVETQAAGLR